ncbi:hypothetical protein NDU88_006503 [Pleurodeles waltl]|uniref:Uncharacterized protein n=1 Tax=Pleurodeles waltl TaxID=8319 RepID=A0AAV7UMY5_PLEWA|nr:hypothetical protein NDU88_006503 [Pleurodeles waltl]
MCLPAALTLGNQPLRKPGEAPGGRLRHWGRAPLELRREQRGSARIPLRGNPGSACTSKVPRKVSREPGRAAMRVFLESLKTTNKAAGSAGGKTSAQEQGKSPSLHQSSDSVLQARPEDIVLVPGQGKMGTYVVKGIGNGADSGKGVEDDFPSPVDNLTLREKIQVGLDVSTTSPGDNLSSLRQEEELLVESVVSPSRDQDLAPDSRYSPSMEEVILSISEDIKKGFASSECNQGEIREACEALDFFFDNLMERIQTLEEKVGGMKEELKHHKDEIQGLNEKEQGLQVRIEQLENYSRRNNIKLLKVPEGAEGANLKSYVVSLIKSVCELEESNEEIEKDIQRVHCDPFTRRPNSTRLRKILVNFLTYHLKEKILTSALKQKSLRMENMTFEIRSDLSKITMDRQWELGKSLDEFKKLGVTAQLKFPALLRIMHNNKMYNIREIDRADELLDVIKKEQADHV